VKWPLSAAFAPRLHGESSRTPPKFGLIVHFGCQGETPFPQNNFQVLAILPRRGIAGVNTQCAAFCWRWRSVEGIKGCQMTGRSIGKAWQQENRPRDMLCRKIAYSPFLCLLAMSRRCQKTVPLSRKGVLTSWPHHSRVHITGIGVCTGS
jgi:hypothetical protein